MHKVTIVLIIIFITLILCSCSLSQESNTENADSLEGERTEMLNKENEGKFATVRLEEIIQAIKDNDKDTIKNMFSKQVQDEANDLNAEIDYLFTLFEGDIESWDQIGGSVDESTQDGNITTKFRYRFNVYTDKEQYLFSILEYTKDATNSENIGLYSLKVINAKDKEPTFSDAGIYKPE